MYPEEPEEMDKISVYLEVSSRTTEEVVRNIFYFGDELLHIPPLTFSEVHETRRVPTIKPYSPKAIFLYYALLNVNYKVAFLYP